MVFLMGQGVILRGRGVLLRGQMVTDDLEALGLCSGSATLFWLDVRKHVKPCTPLPGRAAETRLDFGLSGFVRVSGYPEVGYPDIQWMSGVDHVWICPDMSGYI